MKGVILLGESMLLITFLIISGSPLSPSLQWVKKDRLTPLFTDFLLAKVPCPFPFLTVGLSTLTVGGFAPCFISQWINSGYRRVRVVDLEVFNLVVMCLMVEFRLWSATPERWEFFPFFLRFSFDYVRAGSVRAEQRSTLVGEKSWSCAILLLSE